MRYFDVKGMTCGHCERAVKRTITGQDPDARVSVELAAGRVGVDSSLPDAQVCALIEEEGFSASPAGK